MNLKNIYYIHGCRFVFRADRKTCRNTIVLFTSVYYIHSFILKTSSSKFFNTSSLTVPSRGRVVFSRRGSRSPATLGIFPTSLSTEFTARTKPGVCIHLAFFLACKKRALLFNHAHLSQLQEVQQED